MKHIWGGQQLRHRVMPASIISVWLSHFIDTLCRDFGIEKLTIFGGIRPTIPIVNTVSPRTRIKPVTKAQCVPERWYLNSIDLYSEHLHSPLVS